MDSPSQIYNIDETGMLLDHRPPKVVTKRLRPEEGAQ